MTTNCNCNLNDAEWYANCHWRCKVCKRDVSLEYIIYQELINKKSPNE